MVMYFTTIAQFPLLYPVASFLTSKVATWMRAGVIKDRRYSVDTLSSDLHPAMHNIPVISRAK